MKYISEEGKQEAMVDLKGELDKWLSYLFIRWFDNFWNLKYKKITLTLKQHGITTPRTKLRKPRRRRIRRRRRGIRI